MKIEAFNSIHNIQNPKKCGFSKSTKEIIRYAKINIKSKNIISRLHGFLWDCIIWRSAHIFLCIGGWC